MNVSRLPIGNAPRRSEPEYLTFTNVHESETAYIQLVTERADPEHLPTFYVSRDKRDFHLWDYSDEILYIAPGESIYMYGDNPNGINYVDPDTEILFYCVSFYVSYGSVAVSGNIQTLMDVNNRSASPVPELPGNYFYLFGYGISMISAPLLPATELAPGCYAGMFAQCISLKVSPVLPAKKLVRSCYSGMFLWTDSLKEITALFTEISGDTDIAAWVGSLEGVLYKNPEAHWTNKDLHLPDGWIIKDAEL